MNNAVLLTTTYFGPIEWYQRVNRAGTVLIEQHESFQKQTFRNRCVIATANGRQALTVPVEHSMPNGKRPITQMRISNHGNWRHLHWNALCSAYGKSPFFDYYADDLRPFFEQEWEYLFEYNLAIMRKMMELLDVRTEIRLTEKWEKEGALTTCPEEGGGFQPRRYYQVYGQRHGFQPNLSILDLLFNMGNEAILWL